MNLTKIARAAGALLAEAARRAAGDPADDRYEVQLAMLLDLGDELEIEAIASDPAHVDRVIEELHGTA